MILILRLLSYLALLRTTSAFYAQQNQPCNPQRDILLAEDANPHAFLRCNSIGFGDVGYWERRFCPNDMTFDFIRQQCKTPVLPKEVIGSQTVGAVGGNGNELLNIAILNGSCANGQHCIGGTVCDLTRLTCLCPYGTVANLETLSCVQPQTGYIPNLPPVTEVPHSGAENVNHVGNYQQSPAKVPLPTSSYLKPLEPILGGLKNLAQAVTNYNSNFPSPLQSLSNYTYRSLPTWNTGNGGYKPVAIQTVKPGSSCARGEQCGGGSQCTKPMYLCLCPGELEDHDGQCIMPPRTTAGAVKVGLGQPCNNQYVFCDHDATCLSGRCQCVPPLTEQSGRCVPMESGPKEVGPGELCDRGQICSRGSVCDSKIPVCVCPAGTDLSEGRCVQVRTTSAVLNTFATRPTAVPLPNGDRFSNVGGANYGNYQTAGTAPPPTAQPAQPMPAPATTPAPRNVLIGNGNRQGGVGVRCSLNTDCMQGAYCNGNTQPPTCQCLSTHVNVHGRCEKVIYPGQIGCDHDEQCNAAYAGTRCVIRQCVCPEGFRAIDQTCVSDNQMISAPPGGSCARGEQCTGGAFCRAGWCSCPEADMVISRGECVKQQKPQQPQQNAYAAPAAYPSQPQQQQYATYNPATAAPQTVMYTAPPATHAPQPRRAVPGTSCGPLDICMGGSQCIDGICLCPAGTQPNRLTAVCEPVVATQVPAAPEATTIASQMGQRPANRYARPSSPCSSGEICTGGSVCVDKRICTCPPHKPIIRDYICSSPDETTPTPKFAAPGQACDASTLCTEQSVCYNGKCRCPSGYIAIGGKCARLPPMKTPLQAQTTAAATPATLKDAQSGMVQRSCPEGEVIHNGRCVHPAALQRTPAPSTIAPAIPADSPQRTAKSVPPTAGQRTHHASPGKPVISGPPLRRPKPPGTATVSTYGSGTTVLTGDGPGVCPPGNYPLIEEDGRIRICSGMEPHCPPKSYCYVTGVASANYNCCSVP